LTKTALRYARGEKASTTPEEEVEGTVCNEPSSGTCNLPKAPSLAATWIDAAFSNDEVEPKVRNGVKMGEGDGTVSILSLGAMCVEGWKRPRWNPAGIKVTTIELPHSPDPTIPRGGANTSDHVDVLGSTRMNEIILQVAAGVGHEIEESFVSDIRKYSKMIQWD